MAVWLVCLGTDPHDAPLNSGKCSKGYYCGEASTAHNQNACLAGYHGASVGMFSNTCSGKCYPGHYCLAGSTSPTQKACAAGSWGGLGQSSSSCSGACEAGYYCPAGSSTARQNECGGVKYYCPASSGSRKSVTTGEYTTPITASVNTRTGKATCEAGYYCPGTGERKPCVAGYYGSTTGLSVSTCR